MKNSAIKELLDKCERGKKIASHWDKCQAKWGLCAKEVQFYYPPSTYLAIVSLVPTWFYCVSIEEQFLTQVPSKVRLPKIVLFSDFSSLWDWRLTLKGKLWWKKTFLPSAMCASLTRDVECQSTASIFLHSVHKLVFFSSR